MARRVTWAVAVLLVVMAPLACQRASAQCVPGASVDCACPGGSRGAQVCQRDGTFGPCACAAPAPPPPPAPVAPTPAPPAAPPQQAAPAAVAPTPPPSAETDASAPAPDTACEQRCRAARAAETCTFDPEGSGGESAVAPCVARRDRTYEICMGGCAHPAGSAERQRADCQAQCRSRIVPSPYCDRNGGPECRAWPVRAMRACLASPTCTVPEALLMEQP